MLVERVGLRWKRYLQKRLVIRTGCLACRAQVVRCDPSNQQCQRNSSTDWASNRNQARHPAHNHGDPDFRTTSSLIILSLNKSWSDSLREQESLHFYCVITVKELSGFLNTQFWQRLLPQATHSDTAIKHAVAASGASHEYALRRQASRNSAETNGLLPFSLRQCNKAIHSLLRPNTRLKQGDLMRALTASVLFASFESLTGNKEGAIPHVIHSRRLVEQLKTSQSSPNRSHDFPVVLEACYDSTTQRCLCTVPGLGVSVLLPKDRSRHERRLRQPRQSHMSHASHTSADNESHRVYRSLRSPFWTSCSTHVIFLQIGSYHWITLASLIFALILLFSENQPCDPTRRIITTLLSRSWHITNFKLAASFMKTNQKA